jgi:peptide/nickel transport system permease protein
MSGTQPTRALPGADVDSAAAAERRAVLPAEAVVAVAGVGALDAAPRRGRYVMALSTPRGAGGVVLLVVVVLAVILGPLVLPYGPYDQQADALLGPGAHHLLGTDQVGRDLLSRILAGTRVDLVITLIAVPIAAVCGTFLGLIGVLSNLLGAILQRVFDVLLGVPAIILGIGVAMALTPGMRSVIVAIVLAATPMFGRQARAALLSQLPLDYVAAARVLGFSKRRIMIHHILPNVMDVVFVRTAIVMAHAITIEGGLSVVGLGIQSPKPSLGSMIKEGSAYLTGTPMYALGPIVVVVVLVSGYTLLSDALNRAVLRS